MKATGIIAEYNPLHNGHAYQLAQAKKETGADYVIVAMSGDFLQRGVPSIIDKHTRAQMALSAGADLVLELPAHMATASAEYFARAGVQLLGSTGVVDTICYGCEQIQPVLMPKLTEILTDQIQDSGYETYLARLLRNGMSYPHARQEALCAALPEESADHLRAFLSMPNNILALEYEKSIAEWNQTHENALCSYPIQRIGDGYHDTEVTSVYASATALRALLLPCPDDRNTNSTDAPALFTERNWDNLSRCMPDCSLDLLKKAADNNRLMDTDDFSVALYTALLAAQQNGYESYADCTEALSSRISACLRNYVSFTQFAELLKTKELTHTRINRVLTHIMLGISQEMYQDTSIRYLRVLGFREAAKPLLSSISKKASAPLITKVADASNILSADAMQFFEQDLYAADLYRGICSIQCRQNLCNEYTQPIVIV